MVTRIKSITGAEGSSAYSATLTAHPYDGSLVSVGVDTPSGRRAMVAPRADFLAAVASELNVIIIEKADLPEPLAEWERELLAGADAVKSRPTEAEAWRAVLSAVAEWEHAKANPPVDEAQVEALADVLEATTDWDTNQQRDDLARRLVARGVRVEVKP